MPPVEAQYKFYIDWNDDGDFSDANEDVTNYVAARDSVDVGYGRDSARSLSAIQAGESSFQLYNFDGRFSPDNTGGPLYGMLVPGRRVKVDAIYNSVTYTLLRGYIDGFEILPGRTERVVQITVLDLLNKFSVANMATDMYPSIQTGGAVNALLDEIGWPEADRDIDSGATTLRWWSVAGTDAFEVLASIIEAEGPPAVAYVDGNTFVFRDRHHRLINPESSDVQATFRSGETGDAEPHFCEPMTYNIGWKDLVNRIEISVEETQPDFYQDIFTSEDVISLATGESRQFVIESDEGFIDALTPEEGVDYVMASGSATFGLTRTNGDTTTLEVNCTGTCRIVGLKVRARPVIVRNTVVVKHDDVASQDEHGIRNIQDADLEGMGNVHDALAIAKIITAQRSQRLPVVTITVNSGNSTRLTQILSRGISDRIHIIEPNQTYLDHDFFIDRIEHTIGEAGKDHRVTFSCERSPNEAGDPDPPVYFTFGDASRGLNEGSFAIQGVSFTEVLMILDDPTTGALGTGGLGW